MRVKAPAAPADFLMKDLLLVFIGL
jgi:hypothetical protein